MTTIIAIILVAALLGVFGNSPYGERYRGASNVSVGGILFVLVCLWLLGVVHL